MQAETLSHQWRSNCHEFVAYVAARLRGGEPLGKISASLVGEVLTWEVVFDELVEDFGVKSVFYEVERVCEDSGGYELCFRVGYAILKDNSTKDWESVVRGDSIVIRFSIARERYTSSLLRSCIVDGKANLQIVGDDAEAVK